MLLAPARQACSSERVTDSYRLHCIERFWNSAGSRLRLPNFFRLAALSREERLRLTWADDVSASRGMHTFEVALRLEICVLHYTISPCPCIFINQVYPSSSSFLFVISSPLTVPPQHLLLDLDSAFFLLLSLGCLVRRH